MVTHHEIEVKDGPLYTSSWTSTSVETMPLPEPFESQSDDKILDQMVQELGEGEKGNGE